MGGVTARAMFGGYGLYRHGTVFGMIANESLYLKVDDANREAFVSRGLTAFSHASKTGQKVAMSYFQAPPEALEDGDEMVRWALCSYEAALRGKTSNARSGAYRVGGPQAGRGSRSLTRHASSTSATSAVLGRATAEIAARIPLSSTRSRPSPLPSLPSPRPSARVRSPRR